MRALTPHEAASSETFNGARGSVSISSMAFWIVAGRVGSTGAALAATAAERVCSAASRKPLTKLSASGLETSGFASRPCCPSG